MSGFSEYEEDDYNPGDAGSGSPHYGFGSPLPAGLRWGDDTPKLIPTHPDGLGTFNIKRGRGA